MERETIIELRKLIPALQSLHKSVERALVTETFKGTGNMAVKSYTSLHARVAALLPDDDYITEALLLEVPDDAEEADKVAQVQLAASQLVMYLEQQVRDARRSRRHGGGDIFAGADIDEIKELGQELRDRIVSQTRETLRRAMSNIDIDISSDDDDDDDEAESRGKRKVRVRVEHTDDGDDDEYIEATDDAPEGEVRRKHRVWVTKEGETIVEEDDVSNEDEPADDDGELI